MIRTKTVSFLPGVAALAFSLFLTGCSQSNLSDLEAYVNQVKSRTGGPIEPLPEIKVYETYRYSAADLRSPFVSPLELAEEEEQAVASTNGIAPDLNRPKELLEEYPLDSLRMVGTLEQNQKVWAIIKANDGTIHRVVAGNYMGQNHGKILQITENSIELLEIIPDGQGGWQEREASIALGGDQ
ncbi:MAG: type 4a pilus biogenesis lipoprotein PilP [Gammaproteobacteria bacterium]